LAYKLASVLNVLRCQPLLRAVESSAHKFSTRIRQLFGCFFHLTNRVHQQNCYLVIPTEIAYRMDDGLWANTCCHNLSSER